MYCEVRSWSIEPLIPLCSALNLVPHRRQSLCHAVTLTGTWSIALVGYSLSVRICASSASNVSCIAIGIGTAVGIGIVIGIVIGTGIVIRTGICSKSSQIPSYSSISTLPERLNMLHEPRIIAICRVVPNVASQMVVLVRREISCVSSMTKPELVCQTNDLLVRELMEGVPVVRRWRDSPADNVLLPLWVHSCHLVM